MMKIVLTIATTPAQLFDESFTFRALDQDKMGSGPAKFLSAMAKSLQGLVQGPFRSSDQPASVLPPGVMVLPFFAGTMASVMANFKGRRRVPTHGHNPVPDPAVTFIK